MTYINPLYLARERRRFTRPDAHRFISPDWRRFVRAGSDLECLYEDFERKYSPDQPRVPAGSPEGGQWTSDGGATTTLSAAGHHHIPQAVYKKYNLRPETRKVFEDATTGRLNNPTSNTYDSAHRAYNDAVTEQVDEYLRTNNVAPEQMTPAQAEEVIREVLGSNDPRIRNFIMRMEMREIMYRIMRQMRIRGTE
ncbi:MAG TPA: hypothetical protein VG986_09255 [Pseudolabrys sp.]|nr:hypothetical protein [Pseudolabrys sp.]